VAQRYSVEPTKRPLDSLVHENPAGASGYVLLSLPPQKGRPVDPENLVAEPPLAPTGDMLEQPSNTSLEIFGLRGLWNRGHDPTIG